MDVWSLSVLLACIIYGHAAAQDWLHSCRFMTGRLPNVSAPLRKSFKACLTLNHNKRVGIDGVKRLEFFKHVDWEEVVTCKVKPPNRPSDLKAKEKFDPVSYDPTLLAAVFDRNMPLITR
ncbi:Protein kinase C beta type [Taenia solium]